MSIEQTNSNKKLASKQQVSKPVTENLNVLDQQPQQTDIIVQRAMSAPDLLTPSNVLHLQHSVGNHAVSRLLTGLNQRKTVQSGIIQPKTKELNNSDDKIQRQASIVQRTPEEDIINEHTTLNFLSEEELGSDLLNRLPAQSQFVGRVLNTLGDSDRDDVSYYISHQATDDQLARIGEDSSGKSLMMRMVRELQSGITDDDDATEIERLVRFSSPSHRRLREEDWSSSSDVTDSLTNSGATAQSISSGSGDYIYDEYSIVIERMPPNLTPEQYLAEMANDLNQAVNDYLFDAINEFQRTNTEHTPQVGDIYEIDIKGPDNGSVMLVEQTPSYFIFQTITTNAQGTHPEYGSREFGFERNDDNTIKFYTRGASRPESWIIGVVGRTPQVWGWTRLMRGISDAIDSRGGQARPSSFRSWTTHRD